MSVSAAAASQQGVAQAEPGKEEAAPAAAAAVKEPEPLGQPRAMRARQPVPPGVCRACHNSERDGAQGVSHDYSNLLCKFVPGREPYRSRALKVRAEAKQKAGAALLPEEEAALKPPAV